MDFTRQPIIETVITPKEGCKLVVRNSKSSGQEEYFVEALEVVAFGNAIFYRSTERPKSFLLPAIDYEVIEVREARMALKNVGIERTIKIGGGKEQQAKQAKEPIIAKEIDVLQSEEESQEASSVSAEAKQEVRLDKKRDKRRHSRRRRGRGETAEEVTSSLSEGISKEEAIEEKLSEEETQLKKEEKRVIPPAPPTLLPPPTTLISETIARYKDNALFRSAFYVKEPEELENIKERDQELAPQTSSNDHSHPEDLAEALELQNISLETSEYGYLGFMEEDQNIDFPVSVPEEPHKLEEIAEDALHQEEHDKTGLGS